jgi:hypothetical protein
MSRQAEVIVVVESGSARFDESGDSWLDQVAKLHEDLSKSLRAVPTPRGPPDERSKGVVQAIVVSVASAGSMTALVEMAKAWLGRDRTRSLRFSTTAVDGREISIEVSGADVPNADFEALLRVVTERLADRA